MANLEVLALDTAVPQIRAPGAGDGYSVPRDMTFASGTVLSAPTVDATNVEVTNVKAKDGTAAITIADSTGLVTAGAGVTLSGGNLAFSSTAQRITGDFSNATAANQVLVQTSTTNGSTTFGIITNGTGTNSSIRLFQSSDPANSSVASININPNDFRINSTITGTGTYLPMTFYTGGSERARIDTSGNVGIGTASPGATLEVAGGASNGLARIGQLQFKNSSGSYSTGADGVFMFPFSDGILYSDNYDGGFAWRTGTGSTERMRITSTGAVGIGTSSPAQLFSVYTTGEWPILARGASDTAGNRNSVILTQRARGSISSPTVPIVDTNLGGIEMGGWNGSAYTYGYNGGASIFAHASETWTASANGTYLAFSTTSAGTTSLTERMRIDSEGRVGIGGTAAAFTKVDLLGTLPTSSNFSEGYRVAATIPSGTTNTASMFVTYPSTAAASFTLGTLAHFRAIWNSTGAGSAITTQYGFLAESSLTTATNNFGFYSNIASGSNRWNFYAAGTARNYFAGNTAIGGAGSNDARLLVSLPSGTFGVANPLQRWDYATFSVADFYTDGNLNPIFNADAQSNWNPPATMVWQFRGTEQMRITSAGNIVAGGSVALATTATNGFLYVPTCAGTPTGTPTAITGMAPIVVDTTNNKLYFYSGGQWRDAGP